MTDDMAAGPPNPESPASTAAQKSHRIGVLVGFALAVVLAFAAGIALATYVPFTIGHAAAKPWGDIRAKMEQRLPAPPGTEILVQPVAFLGWSSEKDDHFGERLSLQFEREIELADRQQPPAPPKDLGTRESRLVRICNFYEDQISAMGFRFSGGAPIGHGVIRYAPQRILFVTADYTPYGTSGEECIIVHIVLFDTGRSPLNK